MTDPEDQRRRKSVFGACNAIFLVLYLDPKPCEARFAHATNVSDGWTVRFDMVRNGRSLGTAFPVMFVIWESHLLVKSHIIRFLGHLEETANALSVLATTEVGVHKVPNGKVMHQG